MARAATSPELALYRTPGKWSKLRCAVLTPPIVYRARVNQTFSSLDQVIQVIFDSGSGTLGNVLPDMEVWIGSSADTHDKGICRLRDKDATHFYLSETSEITFADNDYITILAAFGVWARPVRITTGGTVYMDETTYTNQHASWDPMPNMGPHKVAELVSTAVNVGFDASTSFCPGSSISAYLWSCATASAAAGTTTSTVTFQFDTTGWHIVYLTLTAANSKSFFGVRYVYIWDQDNQPPMAQIISPGHCDVDSGGYEIELKLYDGADLTEIYDRAMVILFSEDHYGDTIEEIGPVAGAENIRFIGWISRETEHLESEAGSVTFVANGAAYWMTKIPSWPDGVEITTGATSWTAIQDLNVDLGVYHFLRWRSTVTRVMDVTLSDDTRYSPEVFSGAQNLWAQIQDMTWAQIYARPGVNALNQLSIEIHPSLIPIGDRAFPTVMAITKADYLDGLDFDRQIIEEVGIVDMSGIAVTAGGVGSAYFALAPGHSLPHYGDWDIQPNLLLTSQAQVIEQAGLYRAMRNNVFKSIPIVFDAPIALIDCFPNQKCTIDIQAGDNVRGFAYSGGLIPVAVDLVQDLETGYLHTEVTFEAETTGTHAIQGDTPGSGSTAGPVSPSFPDLPLPPIIIPGIPVPSADGASVAVVHDVNQGLMFSIDFDHASPTWAFFNAGLTTAQKQTINTFFRTPSGACYCGYITVSNTTTSDTFFARAASLGGTWTVIFDQTNLAPVNTQDWGVKGCGYNPLVSDTVAVITRLGTESAERFRLGSGGTFSSPGFSMVTGYAYTWWISYGLSKWMCTGYGNQASGKVRLLPAAGTSVTLASTPADLDRPHIRASTTGKTFHGGQFTYDVIIGTDNFTSNTTLTTGNSIAFYDSFGYNHYIACDPTGTYLMTRGSGGRQRSSDGGFTWGSMGSLPVGNYWFDFAGPTARFVAAGGSVIRYSPDFGGTWYNKEGNATGLVPLLDINLIKVLVY